MFLPFVAFKPRLLYVLYLYRNVLSRVEKPAMVESKTYSRYVQLFSSQNRLLHCTTILIQKYK
jgi:hypothetical protein